MKAKLLLAACLFPFLFSCSTDDGDPGSDSIVGTWDAVTLQLDGATQEEAAAALVFNQLAAQGCPLITMVFGEGGEATLQTSISYLDVSGILSGSFALECPSRSDSESATYTYSDGQLQLTDSGGTTTTVNASLSGDRLTLDLDGSEFDDIQASGSLTFRRR